MSATTKTPKKPTTSAERPPWYCSKAHCPTQDCVEFNHVATCTEREKR